MSPRRKAREIPKAKPTNPKKIGFSEIPRAARNDQRKDVSPGLDILIFWCFGVGHWNL
jgi:hypothetical protein